MAKARGWIRRLFFISGVLLFLAAGGVLVPNLVVAYAAKGYEYEVPSTVPARTVAIVPGASVNSGKPATSLKDRLDVALALYRQDRVGKILVSGNDTDGSPEVRVMRAWLIERGVPSADIWTDESGSRTRETMNQAAARFGIRDAVVCTQTMYLPRSIFLAQQAGIDAVGVGTSSRHLQSTRLRGREIAKTTLAFFESSFRGAPNEPAAQPPAAVAVR